MSLLLCLVSLTVNPIGVTTEPGAVTCEREELARQTRAEWLALPDRLRTALEPLPGAPLRSDDTWVLTDSLRLVGELAPAKRLVVSCQAWRESLDLVFPLDTLPAECQQALNYAPTWLNEELSSAFRRLGDSARFYAQMLLTAPQRYADEIAFCIAKMGPEVLRHRLFNPNLLLDNARFLYQISDSLHYARIVDHGSPPGDYYSTVSYAVLSGPDTFWRELPRDIYYYYIVHPTTSDELPRMDQYVYNQHWREYLFFQADSGYPVLGDYIKQARVVWFGGRQVLSAGRPFTPNDNALDVVGNWAARTLPDRASGNRPIHPSVIAHEHNGNCGEIQDLITAGARACLIPVVNASDPCEDHVWNEFWDQGWYPLANDPSTHIADSGVAYEEAHGGSKRVSAVFDWRPDGYWWTVTGKYSNTCSLYVRVLDARGLPVDGARALIYSEYWYGGLSVATLAYTNDEGAVAFELGDLRNFYLQITTPLGSWPSPSTSVKIVSVSQTGATYFSTVCLPFAAMAPVPRQAFSPDSIYPCRLDADIALPFGLDYGYCVSRGAGTGDPDDSIRFYQFYSDKHPAATADLFIADTTGYYNYLACRRFDAYRIGDNVPTQSISFPCPNLDPYYLILSREDKTYSSCWLDARFRLYRRILGVSEGKTGTPPEAGSVPIFPSVFRRRLRLEVAGLTGPGLVRVYDVSGGLVAEQTSRAPGLTLSTELPAGIYVVRLEQPGINQTRKVVVLP
jgi:hypothetical protein